MKKSVAITTIITLHAAFIGVLLIQAGCSSNEEATKAPSAETATEEVTTIRTDDKVVAEPTEAKIQEGSPNLRAAPTKPAYSMTETIQEPEEANKPSETLNDDVIAPMGSTKQAKVEEQSSEDTALYTVKKGDSISKIAAKHNVSSAKILSLNSIKNANSIRVGQKLKIPANAVAQSAGEVQKQDIAPAPIGEELSVYVVQKGDSLSKIAYKNDMSVAQLMQVNNLKNANIRIGQKLSVKKSGATTVAKKVKSVPAPTKDGEISHKVKAGEFLGSIAAKYSVKVSDIKKRNKISDPRKLRAGQTIIIPVSAVKKAEVPVAPAPVAEVKKEQPKTEAPASVPQAPAQPAEQAPVIVPEKTQVAPVAQPAQQAEESVPVIQL